MDYRQAKEYIHSREKWGIKPGLETIKKLMAELGNPQNSLKFIHVAGTNGKGSICKMTAEILKSSNYRVGLFISPFVVDFRERMQVNSQMIGKDELVGVLEEIIPLVEGMEKQGLVVTEFELITAAAIKWFCQQKCDIVVLETGLGGRLDATNVISTQLISVITSISLDHTNILGSTVEKIATEKAGIIKPGGVTVVYPWQSDSVLKILKAKAQSTGNRLNIPDKSEIQVESSSISGSTIIYKGEKFTIPLAGGHQVKNAQVVFGVVEELKRLGFSISTASIKTGLKASQFASRMEVISQEPLVILDGAHNADGARALAEALGKYVAGRRVIGIVGILRDKAVDEVFRELLPLFSRTIVVESSVKRALNANEALEKAKRYTEKVTRALCINEAVKEALCEAKDMDVVVVCGSLYLVGEIRPILLKTLKSHEKVT